MYFFRALARPSLLSKVDEPGKLSSTFLNEIPTKDGYFSFFEMNSIENAKSEEALNIAIYMIATSPDKWSSNVSAVFIEEEALRNIGNLSDPQLKFSNVVHRNLGKLNMSQVYKMVEVIFSKRNSIVRFDSEDVFKALIKLKKEDWESIYKRTTPEAVLSTRVSRLLNTFFRDNPNGPTELIAFIKEKGGSCSFDKESNSWGTVFPENKRI